MGGCVYRTERSPIWKSYLGTVWESSTFFCRAGEVPRWFSNAFSDVAVRSSLVQNMPAICVLFVKLKTGSVTLLNTSSSLNKASLQSEHWFSSLYIQLFMVSHVGLCFCSLSWSFFAVQTEKEVSRTNDFALFGCLGCRNLFAFDNALFRNSYPM